MTTACARVDPTTVLPRLEMENLVGIHCAGCMLTKYRDNAH
jgi:hypothetical protein